jgi:23S rRNA pseudouridine2605 synthase
MASERIQKILAQAGITSRRKAEELIQAGSVTVNGKLAKLGDKAIWGKDAIKVQGKLLRQTKSPVYVAFHKPKGVICALADPTGRPTLTDYLSKMKTRLFPIGRLDFMSEGLLLLTNDGDFADKVQKRDDIPRVYWVKVKGHPQQEMIDNLAKGARLGEDRKRLVKPHSLRVVQALQNKSIIEVVTLGSGVFDVKNLFIVKGFLVDKITRTAIGHITLKSLPVGEFRFLKSSQVLALLEQPELGMRKIEKDQEKQVRSPQNSPVIRPVKPIKPVKAVKPTRSSF